MLLFGPTGEKSRRDRGLDTRGREATRVPLTRTVAVASGLWSSIDLWIWYPAPPSRVN